MAAKKAASKKRKTTASRKKASRKASRKTASTRKTSRKKPASRKKKSVSRKATSKKKASSKKSSKKKTSRKKAASKKKPSRKAASRKKKSTKRATKKKAPSRKKKTTKRAAPKKKKKASKKKSVPVRRRRTRSEMLSGPIHGIHPYKPRRGEAYMSPPQLDHFREILSAWKRELMFEVDRTVHHMQDEAANFPDPNDRATQESEFGLELRTRDRERKLLRKIDSALTRIEDGSYGFCEETGEEIGLKRLEARPVATLCLEAQERRELAERQFRDRDDRYR